MEFKCFKLIGLLMIVAMVSCIRGPSNDDDSENMDDTVFETGTYIINSGSALAENGSISFYNRLTGNLTNNIYSKANNGDILGNFIESMYVIGDRAFIVIHDQNKIVYVNATTFEREGEITGFVGPKHFLPVTASKAYVSQWGPDSLSGSLAIVSLATLNVEGSIPTRGGPGEMLKIGTSVYVANSGGLLVDSVISKVDIIDQEVEQVIEVGLVPESIQADRNGHIWVLSRGTENPVTHVKREGKLVKIVNDEVQTEMPTEAGAANLVQHIVGDTLYFSMSGWVYDHPIENTEISLIPYIESTCSGLGFEPEDRFIYCLNGDNTFVEGELLIYDLERNLLDSKELGLAPRAMWFR